MRSSECSHPWVEITSFKHPRRDRTTLDTSELRSAECLNQSIDMSESYRAKAIPILEVRPLKQVPPKEQCSGTAFSPAPEEYAPWV